MERNEHLATNGTVTSGRTRTTTTAPALVMFQLTVTKHNKP